MLSCFFRARHGFSIQGSCLALFILALSVPAVLADWPQLRGPNGDGSVDDSIKGSWLEQPPRVVWRTSLKNGFSSLVVAGDTISTIVLREADGALVEACIGLDRGTGAERWATLLGPAKYTGVGYDSGNYGAPGNQGGDGPRSTPTIDGDRIYLISSRLRLLCLDAADGAVLWRRDIVKDFNGAQITYENAASPVVEGNRVLLAGGGPGESIICLDKFTGQVIWKKHDDQLTHSTPLITRLHGAKQAIFYTKSGLLSLDPASGDPLWRYQFPFRVCAAITPTLGGDMVYCSAGYGIGSGVCQVTAKGAQFAVSEIWRKRHNEPVASYWSTPIHRGGFLYGIFGFKKFHTAPFKCVEMKTGIVKWTQPGFGHGNVIRVGDLLIALTGFGEARLIRPSPAAYQEVGRFKALGGKCWSTPAFSNGRLYLRSTTEGVCLELPTSEPAGNLASSPRKAVGDGAPETAAD